MKTVLSGKDSVYDLYPMKFLVMINHAPTHSGAASAALRFVQAALESEHTVAAVFFHGDGVFYATEPGAGIESRQSEWKELGEAGLQLLLCSTASLLRLGPDDESGVSDWFTSAGLVQMWGLASRCDRVVTF